MSWPGGSVTKDGGGTLACIDAEDDDDEDDERGCEDFIIVEDFVKGEDLVNIEDFVNIEGYVKWGSPPPVPKTVGVTIFVNTNANNYRIQKILFEGKFSKVFQCANLTTGKDAALKVVTKQRVAKLELEMLNVVNVLDPEKKNILRFFETFTFEGYTCLVFELLDITLYNLMKKKNWTTLSLVEIRPIAHQLLTALDALKSLGVIHTNLKLDNVMLVNYQAKPTRVKLIGFGMSRTISGAPALLGKTCQALGYRAPEVILGLPISEAVDMWSLGCLLAFLDLGQYLFGGDNNSLVLKYMVQILGKIPEHLLCAGLHTQQYFRQNNDSFSPKWQLKTEEEYKDKNGEWISSESVVVLRLHSLDELVTFHEKKRKSIILKDRRAFVDFLKCLLQVDVEQRISPEKALKHPFLTMDHLQHSRRLYALKSYYEMKMLEVDSQPEAVIGRTHAACPTGDSKGAHDQSPYEDSLPTDSARDQDSYGEPLLTGSLREEGLYGVPLPYDSACEEVAEEEPLTTDSRDDEGPCEKRLPTESPLNEGLDEDPLPIDSTNAEGLTEYPLPSDEPGEQCHYEEPQSTDSPHEDLLLLGNPLDKDPDEDSLTTESAYEEGLCEDPLSTDWPNAKGENEYPLPSDSLGEQRSYENPQPTDKPHKNLLNMDLGKDSLPKERAHEGLCEDLLPTERPNAEVQNTYPLPLDSPGEQCCHEDLQPTDSPHVDPLLLGRPPEKDLDEDSLPAKSSHVGSLREDPLPTNRRNAEGENKYPLSSDSPGDQGRYEDPMSTDSPHTDCQDDDQLLAVEADDEDPFEDPLLNDRAYHKGLDTKPFDCALDEGPHKDLLLTDNACTNDPYEDPQPAVRDECPHEYTTSACDGMQDQDPSEDRPPADNEEQGLCMETQCTNPFHSPGQHFSHQRCIDHSLPDQGPCVEMSPKIGSFARVPVGQSPFKQTLPNDSSGTRLKTKWLKNISHLFGCLMMTTKSSSCPGDPDQESNSQSPCHDRIPRCGVRVLPKKKTIIKILRFLRRITKKRNVSSCQNPPDWANNPEDLRNVTDTVPDKRLTDLDLTVKGPSHQESQSQGPCKESGTQDQICWEQVLTEGGSDKPQICNSLGNIRRLKVNKIHPTG
ncbi:uncharacterized protein LOC133558729 [Nerophis ophidion]|uniref:uncharacterized protein LOC133558729 n=1 Tax=Nerophis ophidion TaxID=159077 RepID=UPI002AE06D73|nr:uncharacterized protein LOC133558729 [Nerophis ophidion]